LSQFVGVDCYNGMPGFSDIWIAVALTVLAGLATGVGALVTMFARRPSTRLLAFSMGLSAGVMTYISFMELLPEAREAFVPLFGERGASVRMLLALRDSVEVVVVINASNAMELGWIEEYPSIKSVILAPGPGQTGFNALGNILSGKVNRVMIIGKGSLFLGRMTNLFDGVSFVIQANSGAEKASGVSEDEVKSMIAKAMKDFAATLMADAE